MNRSALIAIATLAIIAALLWFFWPKSREREPQTAPRIVQTPYSYEIESRKNPSEQSSFRFFDTFTPIVKPFEVLIPSADHLEISSRGNEADEAIPLSPAATDESRTMTNNKKIAPLSEQEIFGWIWPEDYRRGLAEIETLYINAGYIASRAPTNFDDEQNIYQFLALTLDVAETQGWIIPSDATMLRKGLKETLPDVIEHDKNLLRQGLMPISFLPKDIDILKLRWVILANIAQASPGWVTSPDCYKDDMPLNPLPGPNIWAECCNCGLFCVGYYCKYVPDCEEQSRKCNVPLGCLNLACRAFPNAIWDPLPGTGICGCG